MNYETDDSMGYEIHDGLVLIADPGTGIPKRVLDNVDVAIVGDHILMNRWGRSSATQPRHSMFDSDDFDEWVREVGPNCTSEQKIMMHKAWMIGRRTLRASWSCAGPGSTKHAFADIDRLSELLEALYAVRHRMTILRNELDCRREHGAGWSGHLSYVESELEKSLSESDGALQAYDDWRVDHQKTRAGSALSFREWLLSATHSMKKTEPEKLDAPQNGAETMLDGIRKHNIIVKHVLDCGGSTDDCVKALHERVRELERWVGRLVGLCPRRITVDGKTFIWRVPDSDVPELKTLLEGGN